jgi:hypothetical protein
LLFADKAASRSADARNAAAGLTSSTPLRPKMEEANQPYHPQIVRAIIAIALYEARKEIKRKI